MIYKRPLSNQGVALIMALWVMTLLGVLAMSFSFSTRREGLGARNFKEETKAYYLALSACENAMRYLVTDKDRFADFLDSEGNVLTDKERPSISGKEVMDEVEITVRLTDEESRLNLNFLSPDLLKKMLSRAGVGTGEDADAEDVPKITDAVMDWKDPDDFHHLMGAETDYYESLPQPYKAKNNTFDSVEELALVKGFKSDYLRQGAGGERPLGELLTIYGSGININTVPREVLELLGASAFDIDRVFTERKEPGGLKAAPAPFPSIGVNLTASTHFRLEVSARPVAGGQAVRITTILERMSEPEGMKLKTLYWRQSA